jgi:hypothetical protein
MGIGILQLPLESGRPIIEKQGISIGLPSLRTNRKQASLILLFFENLDKK